MFKYSPISELEKEGFDVSNYMILGGWTQEEVDKMTEEQYHHIPSNWYSYGQFSGYYINLNELRNEFLNDLVINFDNVKTIAIYNENPTFDIDQLMDKLNGMTVLYINECTGYLTITRLPPTLKEIKNNNNKLEITNFPDTLEYYEIHQYDTEIIIPKLPEKNFYLKLYGKCFTNSFFNLSSLITKITIKVKFSKFNIDLWPLNLKQLTLKFTDDDFNHSYFENLPYGLEIFNFEAQNYNHQFDVPPTLKNLRFICKDNYSYTDCFNNLPDSINRLCVKYNSWKNIYKLPKKCTNFIYIGCPNDVFNHITKNKIFKHVQISKKDKFL